MHRRCLLLLFALAACHKDTPSTASPVAIADLDALWAKAPDHAMVGIVASPRAIAMIEHGWHDVHAFLKALPQFAPTEQQMADALAKSGLAPDFAFADVGIGPAKGAALFVADGGKSTFAIFPIVDRDKFLAKAKATKGKDFDKLDHDVCKPIDGGYYACTDSADAFARFGKGNLRPAIDQLKGRGDIEVVASGPVRAAAVVQLDRGAITIRGSVAGVPSAYLSKLPAPQPIKVDLEHSSGFGMIDLRPLVTDIPELPLVAGVTTTQLVKTIAGPLTVQIAAGDFGIEARMPLSDAAPFKTVIEHCAELPESSGARFDNGACHVPVPQMNIDLIASVDGKDLKLTTSASAKSPVAVTPSAIGAELAKDNWSAVFWGRGTILANAPAQGFVPWQQLPDSAQVMVRALAMFGEMGIGVRGDGDTLRFLWTIRTGWANPDDVVAKLATIDPQKVVDGKGAELGKAIADASPNAPFATDFKSGYGGLMIPTAIVGMMAAVAVPAYLEYMATPRRDPQALAELGAKRLAFEAYPQWAAAHPDKECPDKIDELYEYVDPDAKLDPWGHPYDMKCGANLPAGAKGIAITSPGRDGQLGTDDDIKSWER